MSCGKPSASPHTHNFIYLKCPLHYLAYWGNLYVPWNPFHFPNEMHFQNNQIIPSPSRPFWARKNGSGGRMKVLHHVRNTPSMKQLVDMWLHIRPQLTSECYTENLRPRSIYSVMYTGTSNMTEDSILHVSTPILSRLAQWAQWILCGIWEKLPWRQLWTSCASSILGL